MTTKPYNFSFEAQFDPDQAELFKILQTLRDNVHTVDLVRVLTVTPVSDRVGFVSVQPLVLESDTANVVIAQSPAYNVPYLRMQGGASAVILDPVAGDIGLCLYAQRDITSVKQTLAEGPAPTARAWSTGDGLYIGGVLNGAPSQYVRFQPGGAGIDVVSPGNVTLQAAGAVTITSGGATTVNAAAFVVNAPATFNNTISGTKAGSGNYSFAGPISAPDIILPAGSVNTHTHGGVQTGSGTTRPMNT